MADQEQKSTTKLTRSEADDKLSTLQCSIDILTKAFDKDRKEQKQFRDKINVEIIAIKQQSNVKVSLAEISDNIKTEFTLIRKDIADKNLALQKDIADKNLALQKDIDRLNQSICDLTAKQSTIENKLTHIDQIETRLTHLETEVLANTTEIQRSTEVNSSTLAETQKKVEQLLKQLPQIEDIAIPQITEKLHTLEDKLITNTDIIQQFSDHQINTRGEPLIDLNDIQTQISLLKDQQAKMEDRSRRNNLIITGIPLSKDNESWNDTLQLVTKVLRDELQLTHLNIDRAHRINTSISDAIVVKFNNLTNRDEVYSKRFELQDRNIRIKGDFSLVTKDKRSKLWNYAQEVKTEDTRFSLRYDKLHMNGETFICETNTGKISKIDNTRSVPQRKRENRALQYTDRIKDTHGGARPKHQTLCIPIEEENNTKTSNEPTKKLLTDKYQQQRKHKLETRTTIVSPEVCKNNNKDEQLSKRPSKNFPKML